MRFNTDESFFYGQEEELSSSSPSSSSSSSEEENDEIVDIEVSDDEDRGVIFCTRNVVSMSLMIVFLPNHC